LSFQTRLVCAAVAGVVLGAASMSLPALAGERITLSNGFEMRCDHHAQIGSQVRLYFTPDDSNYIERKPEEITGVEFVADPPPGAARSSSAKAGQDAELSQADLHEMLAEAGRQHNLNVDLLASVVKAESNGNAHALSRAGARGLMQLMPKTASDHGVNDSFRPDENVRGGSAYLDELLARYHDNLALALAAYNAGPGAVDKYHGIPPYHETRVYVARVIHEFNRRALVRQGEQALQGGQARHGGGPQEVQTPQRGTPSVNLAAASTR
jgi:Transglycosylase SLT domain